MEAVVTTLLNLAGHLLFGQVLWLSVAAAAIVAGAIAFGLIERLTPLLDKNHAHP